MNGYPLVFSDSGGYLRIGTELYFPHDRPATYGLAIAPFHWLGGTWAVIVAQALFASFLIRRVLCLALGTASLLQLLATTSLLAVTSLPWFAGQIMPDLFTGLLPLLLFVLFRGAVKMQPFERLMWLLLAAGVIAFHLTHIVIASAVWVVLLLCDGALGSLRRDRTGAALAFASIVLAIVGMSSLNLIGAGRFKPSLMGGTFMFARLLDDGIGQTVLEEACRREPMLICAVKPFATRPGRDLLGQAYLWDADSPRGELAGIDAPRLAEEEMVIVKRAISTRPDGTLRLMFSGWGKQLLHVRSGDGLDPYGQGTQIFRQIHVHFPASAPAWMASREQHGALRQLAFPWALGIAAASLAAMLLLLNRVRNQEVLAFSAALITTVLINAAVCGILSGPFDRYQSRVIWLPTFGLMLAALAWARATRTSGDLPVEA